MAIDAGDTAFMIVSMALVNLMTPGLAFFYGGLVRSTNVLTIMLQNYVSMGLITVVWVAWGYSLCFGHSKNGVIGSARSHYFLEDMDNANDYGGACPSWCSPGSKGCSPSSRRA